MWAVRHGPADRQSSSTKPRQRARGNGIVPPSLLGEMGLPHRTDPLTESPSDPLWIVRRRRERTFGHPHEVPLQGAALEAHLIGDGVPGVPRAGAHGPEKNSPAQEFLQAAPKRYLPAPVATQGRSSQADMTRQVTDGVHGNERDAAVIIVQTADPADRLPEGGV